MNPAYYIPIFVLFIILFLVKHDEEKIIGKKLIQKRNAEDKLIMIELAKRFIEKECLIYTFDGGQISGTIKEVCDGALWVESNHTLEAVNLDFVLRIREYPKNKKGKKKSVVLD